MVLFVLQFSSVCNFGEFISFGFGAVTSERVIVERKDTLLVKSKTINLFGSSRDV